LQDQLLNPANDKLNTSAESSINLDDKIAKAIEQLSLMILSKVYFFFYEGGGGEKFNNTFKSLLKI